MINPLPYLPALRFFIPSLVFLVVLTKMYGQQPVHQLDLARIEPDSGLMTRISGVSGDFRDGSLGVPVAGGQDLDGDGHNDLAIAYMRAGPLDRFGAGEVYLVLGNGVLGEDLTAQASPRVLRIAGLRANSHCGDEVWMGEFNGDGLGDLLIGCQDFRPPERSADSGALVILPGTPALREMAARQETLDLAHPPEGVQVLILQGPDQGPVDEARLGVWMRSGDVDGDGIDDIVVGADKENSNRGAVYVLRGGAHLAAGGRLDIFPHHQRLQGHLARIHLADSPLNAHLGATCQLGDLDGNGRAEVLAAATLNRAGALLGGGPAEGGLPGGSAFIIWDESFPAASWPEDYAFALQEAPGPVTTLDGRDVGHSFGEELLAGGDWDGDGFPDLFVGDLLAENAKGVGWIFFDAAALRGRLIELAQLPQDIRLTRIIGPEADAIGADTAAWADFDGDGWDDLLTGSPHAAVVIDGTERSDAGKVHILFGQPAPWPQEIDTSPAGLAQVEGLRVTEILGAHGTRPGGDGGDTLCYSAAAGDIDGDGVAEALINEMVGNGPGPADIDIGNLILLDWRTLAAPSGVLTPPRRPQLRLPPRLPRPAPPR